MLFIILKKQHLVPLNILRPGQTPLYLSPLCYATGFEDYVILQQTVFGYVFGGSTSDLIPVNNSCCRLICYVEDELKNSSNFQFRIHWNKGRSLR